MDKEKILTKIQDCGIVAVVRAESVDKAIRITDACLEAELPQSSLPLPFLTPIRLSRSLQNATPPMRLFSVQVRCLTLQPQE